MNKVRLFLGFFLVLSASTTFGQKKYELSVQEAVDLAYKNVIEIKNAELDYRIQEAKNRQILGQALPQVSGTAGASYYLKLPILLFPQSDQGVYNVLIREGLLPATAKAPPPTFAPFSFQQPWNLNF